jgi:predicted aspartyl protease
MSIPYDSNYIPLAPVLILRLAAPGESQLSESLSAIIDTGSDGTLIPTQYLEMVEAIGLGDAILHSVLGETREVHLYEVDLHIEGVLLPGMVVVGDDKGEEVIIGRNILNKLILLIDGRQGLVDILEQRPR